jgi:hypothetical protein
MPRKSKKRRQAKALRRTGVKSSTLSAKANQPKETLPPKNDPTIFKENARKFTERTLKLRQLTARKLLQYPDGLTRTEVAKKVGFPVRMWQTIRLDPMFEPAPANNCKKGRGFKWIVNPTLFEKEYPLEGQTVSDLTEYRPEIKKKRVVNQWRIAPSVSDEIDLDMADNEPEYHHDPDEDEDEGHDVIVQDPPFAKTLFTSPPCEPFTAPAAEAQDVQITINGVTMTMKLPAGASIDVTFKN